MVTYGFQTEIIGDVISGSAMPIYDHETGLLAGGFNVARGNLVACFLSGHGYPSALQVSSGESFFLTPIENKSGQVCGAYVSMHKLGPRSVNVPMAEPVEEQVDDENQAV